MKNRNTITIFTTIVLVLAGFALLPEAQAVSPAPDGGYANGNTAEGTNALFSLTTCADNTAAGFLALFSNTTGFHNTANGFEALAHNTTGFQNAANGFQALFGNTTGFHNTANGFQALVRTTTGNHNTANGDSALEGKLDFAFDPRLGYLTACPTNVGTGMRASAMLHLPGLVLSELINQVIQAVSKIGLAVRGLYGDGTEAMGNPRRESACRSATW